MHATEILRRFNAEPDPDHAGRAFCPVHEKDSTGHKPSLIIDVTENGKALVLCESMHCDIHDIVQAAGLSLRDLDRVVGVDQFDTRKKTPHVPAGQAARGTQEYNSNQGAYALHNHLLKHFDDHADPVVQILKDRFGVEVSAQDDEGRSVLTLTPTYAMEMGIGLDLGDMRLWVTVRTAAGDFAFAQGRALDDSVKERWKGLKNPRDARWDSIGFIGRRHPEAPVVIVEGLSDGLTVAVLDRYDVLAYRGSGAANSISHVVEALRGRRVILAIDNDEAGRKGRAEIIRALAQEVDDLRVVRLPEGADVSDVRAQDPKDFPIIFQTLVSTAEDAILPDAPIDWGADNLRSQDRIARRFERYAQGKATYVPGKGWHIWNGQYWSPDPTQSGVWHLLDDVIERSWADAQDEALRRDLIEVMKTHNKKGVLEAAAKRMEQTEVDTDPYLLNCENGTLDLREGQVRLRAHRPEDFITKTTGVRYNPDAKGETWAAFLDSSLPEENRDARDFLQRYCGLSLIGRVREHVILVMTGTGRNGKGVFVRALENALGDYIGPNVKDILLKGKYADTEKRSAQDNDALMGLKGCRISCISELPKGATLDEATVKFLTGGDDIVAKYSHGSYQSFTPSHSFILQTNDLPEVDADSPAIWARIRVVPWTVSFIGKEDPTLDERLEAQDELEAILAWCVEGLVQYWADGGRLHAPESVMASTERYREENDTLAQFIAENVDLGAGLFVGKSQFKTAYTAWLRENDAGEPMKAKDMKDKLRKEYDVHDDGPKKRIPGAASPVAVWSGMTLKEADENAG